MEEVRSTDVISFSGISLPREKRPKNSEQPVIGSNGIGGMNQLLDTDNQQEHKKNSNKNILFPKAVNSDCACQNDKQILSGQRYAHEKFDSFYPVFAAKVGIFMN